MRLKEVKNPGFPKSMWYLCTECDALCVYCMCDLEEGEKTKPVRLFYEEIDDATTNT